MRSAAPLLVVTALAVVSCSDGDADSGMGASDGGTSDGGADAGDLDAGAADAEMPDSGDGPFPCDPLHAPSLMQSAPLTGRIEITDYDYYEQRDLRNARVRNAGVNFRTQNLPPRPSVDAVLWTLIPADDCIVFEMLAPNTPLGPSRNIGTEITIHDASGTRLVRMARTAGAMGVEYDWATQADLLAFFDPTVVAFDKRLTYASPGDPIARVRPARASPEPFGNFVVQPAVSSTSAAVLLDPNGQLFTWTSSTVPGQFSIVLSRSLNPTTGDGRYLVCRPVDDGSFTVPASRITEFAAPPGSTFGVDVARASFAGFCNEGVPVGAVSHVLAYLGVGRFD